MEEQEVTIEYDSPRRDNYNTILAQADKEDAAFYEQNLPQYQDTNPANQKFTVKAIGGDNNLQKNKKKAARPVLVPPCKMICVRNSVLENEVFPLIADENIDPDDLNKKINYGITDNFSKMDAKMVKVVQSKMKIEAMKKRQMQYQQGMQRQMDEKQAKQQQSRNSFIEHRIKNCKQQSKKWQDRKQNHDHFVLEKEILKQIMQDEYLNTQQEFWQRKEGTNSLSQQFDLIDQTFSKSTQFVQRNTAGLNIQVGKPPKDTYRPDTANTVNQFIQSNSRQQKRQHNIELESERNEIIKSLNLIGDRIGTNRSQTAGTAASTQATRKKLLTQSFYNPSLTNKSMNMSYSQKRDNSLQNQQDSIKHNFRSNLISDQIIEKNQSTQDAHSRSLIRVDSNNQQQYLQNNLISEINIHRDFYIQNPYTRSIIQESLTQPISKKNLSLDQNSLVSDNLQRQQTPSSIHQMKPRFSNILKTPKTALNNLVTPNSMNMTSTKFQSISPAHSGNITFKKQDQKLSYDKRRYKCLNKIYEIKINQLNQDEVFTDKMRKQKLQDLVRRKISANFPGNYKLKINFSLVEKLDQEDDNQIGEQSYQEESKILLQTLQQQNVMNDSKQQTNKGWNTQSHQIPRNRQQNSREVKQRLQSQSFNVYNNNYPSSDEDGEDVIKYIKNI